MSDKRTGGDAFAEGMSVALEDGHAERMGDGMFVVFQTIGERTFSVTLSREDMAKMLAMD